MGVGGGGVEVGWMGAGAVGCSPRLNGVPRPREAKIWKVEVGGGDGNQSTSPFGIT